MTGEFNIDGVLISSVLISALIALAAALVLRRIMAWAGLYRFVWHRALFDVAVFVILWAIVIAIHSPLAL